ncbi:MAG: FAD-dependent oxidoreductase [Proteobacteria bacterium]|nr:FAD-dependent oxidoreductase [Pseudomonadota bacterium]
MKHRLRPERLEGAHPAGQEQPTVPLTCTVVGGGLAGAAAATVLAERGVSVTWIEREAYLGGRVGAWTEQLPDGEPFEMERGFHAFFRQYYNLRALLRRFDPDLSMLQALEDYPILGPGGARQSFRALPRRTPFNLVALTRRTPSLGLRALRRVDLRAALRMLAFDQEQTYRRFDGETARAYLDSLRFPPAARQLLFEVFAHSFFNPEEEMSAAELLMMFHFYFTGNPEGLLFDVLRKPFSQALWAPLERYLLARAATVQRGESARKIERRATGWRVVTDTGAIDSDLVVLALPVAALQRLVADSPELKDPTFRRQVAGLALTRPFAVLRLWLDRPLAAERAPFAGTAGVGLLDNISLYDRFEDESAAWSARSGGAVVELHAYALPPSLAEQAVRAELLAGLHALYPETRAAAVIHERYLWRDDCPAFAPHAHADRPTVATPFAGIALAGDALRLPFPSALMEKAVSSGFLAANNLLAPHGLRSEPLLVVPTRGLLAPLLS